MDKVYNKEMMFIFKGKAKDILKDKDVKFDKKKFSNILIKIVDSYGSQREFCRITKISRTRISEYMNCKVNKPPNPGFIMRLAYYSQDIISYDELMTMCGYESPDVIIKNKRLRERNFIL